MSVVELVDVVTHGEERNEHLFVTLVDTLQAINSATKNIVNALYFMEMKLSEIMGFRPDFLACLHCRTPLDEHSIDGAGAEVHLSLGGALCSRCSRQGMGHPTLGAATVKVLQRLQNAHGTDSIMNIGLTPQMSRDVGGVLRHYLQKHIENFRTLKSEGVFSAIM